jgi:hypothetical protein
MLYSRFPDEKFTLITRMHGGQAHSPLNAPKMATLHVTRPVERAETTERVSTWKNDPSARELFCMVALTGLVFVAFMCVFQTYASKVDNFGDNNSYMAIASAIRHWDFHGLIIEHFWGLPYVMALLSLITHISGRAALLAVSVASSFASVLLAHRLWGGWVAAFFAVLSFDWMQRSFLGGSEPLFAALIFAAFLAIRRDRWLLAALLAALATVTRPLGLFALIAIGLVLLLRREFVKCALATTIGIAVGVAYATPLALYFGSPLANIHGYNPSGNLFGWPFYAIIKGTILYPAPWTNLILSFGWIFLVSAACIAMAVTRDYRAYARRYPAEAIFAALYLLSVYCYNYPYWARGSFPRFVIPAVPFVLLALSRWIPKDRRLLWTLTVIMPLLAAASAIGVQSVAASLKRFW